MAGAVQARHGTVNPIGALDGHAGHVAGGVLAIGGTAATAAAQLAMGRAMLRASFGWGGVCAVGAACAAAALLLVRSRAGNYARGQRTLAAPTRSASSSTAPLM